LLLLLYNTLTLLEEEKEAVVAVGKGPLLRCEIKPTGPIASEGPSMKRHYCIGKNHQDGTGKRVIIREKEGGTLHDGGEAGRFATGRIN